MRKCLWITPVLLTLLGAAGCTARKVYPDPSIGWHSGDYTVIFGRLQLVPAPASKPDEPPAWTVRYSNGQDTYGGVVALTPAERFVGYSGGERVEIHGHLKTDATTDQYTGRWYVVDSIRMWEGYR